MNKNDFTRYFATFRHYRKKKVKSVELKVSVENVKSGEIRITDLQLQEGPQATGSAPATKDMFHNQRFDIDESYNAVGNDVYLGDPPQIYSNVRNRFFNFANRGHAVMVVPNVYHQDYRIELLPTGLDLVIYPKDDFDFLRVSTNYGELVHDEEEKTYPLPQLENHPLNYRYTREFCFSGGETGDEIKISASGHYASVNGNKVPLGVQRFYVGQYKSNETTDIYFKNRQRFMLIPWGSARIRIEFYKMVEETFTDENGEKVTVKYLKDTGIGYWGIVEFTQWTEGVSKF